MKHAKIGVRQYEDDDDDNPFYTRNSGDSKNSSLKRKLHGEQKMGVFPAEPLYLNAPPMYPSLARSDNESSVVSGYGGGSVLTTFSAPPGVPHYQRIATAHPHTSPVLAPVRLTPRPMYQQYLHPNYAPSNVSHPSSKSDHHAESRMHEEFRVL
jgi:hypothetical protein